MKNGTNPSNVQVQYVPEVNGHHRRKHPVTPVLTAMSDNHCPDWDWRGYLLPGCLHLLPTNMKQIRIQIDTRQLLVILITECNILNLKRNQKCFVEINDQTLCTATSKFIMICLCSKTMKLCKAKNWIVLLVR